MTVNKRKKVTKYRAHTTHGGGHRKKRRGAGSRGGRGNAGSGKRAGHKRYGKVLGAKGFRPRRTENKSKTINVGHLTESRLTKLVASGKATQKGDIYMLDLGALGYTKLLAAGNVEAKLNITVAQSSSKAVAKVEAAGGKVMASTADSASEDEEKPAAVDVKKAEA